MLLLGIGQLLGKIFLFIISFEISSNSVWSFIWGSNWNNWSRRKSLSLNLIHYKRRAEIQACWALLLSFLYYKYSEYDQKYIISGGINRSKDYLLTFIAKSSFFVNLQGQFRSSFLVIMTSHYMWEACILKLFFFVVFLLFFL